LAQPSSKTKYACLYCKWPSFSLEQLCIHVPLYHTNEQEFSVKCNLCQRPTHNYAVHLHDEHNPEQHPRSIAGPLYAFSLVVCRRKRDNCFLVVQES
ncbi:unnamed protein product, partial [Rotaria magnacalcarata]